MKGKRIWMVFFYRGKELLRYTMENTFPGEREQTMCQLAYENNISVSEIYFAVITD